MTEPNRTSSSFDEVALIQMTLTQDGWAGERSVLPEAARVEIRSLLSRRLTPDQVDSMLTYLNHGFGNAVAIAVNQRVLQDELAALAEQTGLTKPAPRKLGPPLRDYLRALRKTIEDAQDGHRRVTLDQIVRDISAFPVLDRLVEACLEERLPGAINPLRTMPEQSAGVLLDVLSYLDEGISDAAQRGPTDAAATYLAQFFVNVYQGEIGEMPGRAYDPTTTLETGTGLEVCRVLARALHMSFPEDDRPAAPADMAKAYRKAVDRAKADRAARLGSAKN